MNISKCPRIFNILGRRCGGWWTSAARPGVLSSLPVSSGVFCKSTSRWSKYKYQCCGSGTFIPNPTFFHPGSRIRIKEFKYFNPKKWFLSSRKYDQGCSSRIPDPDPFTHSGSRGQKGTRSRIRNTGEYGYRYILKIREDWILRGPAHARLLQGPTKPLQSYG